jgi:hypothetical protein
MAPSPPPKVAKVFWFFFSKKNRLLPYPQPERKQFFFEKKNQKTFSPGAGQHD